MKYLCPECRLLLEERSDNLICKCGNNYKIIDGIPCFSKIDPFYEGAWKNTSIEADGKVSFGKFFHINFSKDTYPTRYRFIRKCLKKYLNSRAQLMLDLGCGGGKDIFSKIGIVVGADISFISLKNAKNIYYQCVQIDITKPLPFENEIFNFISSEEVFEHIENKNKDSVIREVYRVLKKGGEALFIFETTGLFHKLDKLKPDYYAKYFITQFGHLGLESSEKAIERFKRNNLKISRVEKHFSLFFPTRMLIQYLDNEYAKESFFLGNILKISKFISRSPRLSEIINYCLGFFQEILEIFLPVNAGSSLFVLCKKI